MVAPIRLSRLRRNPHLRNMVAETNLEPHNFIYPVFVEEEINENIEIKSMPGQSRIAEKNLSIYVKKLYASGIKAIILFGISHHKDEKASDSLHKSGTLARIINIAKNAVPEMFIISDNCFCEYTDHGHCGCLKNGFLDHEASAQLLGEQAVICAQTGCDMVAPSAMIDGQIYAMRKALDSHNFSHIPIMSYAVKYASSFYGPFRDAACSSIGSQNILRDRKTYQMDMRNAREALSEARIDEQEGADILMVKPAGLYLDIINKIYEASNRPLAAYQVSGEYSAIKFAASAGALDETQAMIESLIAIKRAGASLIISYFTPEIIQILNHV